MPIRSILTGILFLAAAGAEAQIHEFNAGCVAAGCFPGDGPGFPVEITRPGHYRMTSVINNPDPAIEAVVVDATEVTLDLNGFTLYGPNRCRYVATGGGQLQCRYQGGADLVWVTPSSDNVRISRGYIRGAAGSGMMVGYFPLFMVDAVEIEDVTVTDSGQYGIQCLCRTGTIQGSHAVRSYFSGFSGVPHEVLYLDSHARLNRQYGFRYGVCRDTISDANLLANYDGCDLLGPVVDGSGVVTP